MTTWLLALLLSCAPAEDAPESRLADATSPYLLEAAHDRVDWHPWGEAAFEAARVQDKPIFLSIGYATCHWCHVMARESFRDPEIAALLNDGFVPVKVDREQRPDVDEHYLGAVKALTGRAGWPATLVLTPDGEVIFGGGYFPARDGDREGQRGLLSVLREVGASWRTDRAALLADARALSQRLVQPTTPPPADRPGPEALHAGARSLLATWDREHGGFGRAPKFPRPMVVSWLLRYHRRTSDPEAREAALHALRALAAGAVRDPLGGGFHRYAVDAAWDVPHFEKTLPDQALLAIAFLEAYQLTGDPELAQVARETLEFVARELRLPEGGFATALDADSLADGAEGAPERVEGAFYTWTADEVRAAAPDRADALIAALDLTDAPEVGERHAPRRVAPLDLEDRRVLFQARTARPRPALDDKVVTAWNGLAISAFARAHLILGDDVFLRIAQQAAVFLMREVARDPPSRVWRAGRADQDALLEDYTFLAQALLDLYETTGDATHLVAAAGVQQRCDERLGAPDGTWFRSAHADPRLPRSRPRRDGNEPSGASVGLLNLLRLAELLGDDPWRARAEAALRGLAQTAREQGHLAPALLAAVDFDLDHPRQIVLLGEPGEPRREALLDVVRTTWLPNRVLVTAPTSGSPALAKTIGLLEGKGSTEPTAYVCERGVCEAPTSEPDVLRAQLAQVVPLPTPSDSDPTPPPR